MSTDQKTLHVIDHSATQEYPVRTHEIVVGGKIVPITFEYGKDTFLPYEQAVKFMHEGFSVMEPGGSPMAPPPKTDETIRFRIREDEVVARYDELTDSAIRQRAVAKIDGEKFLVGELNRSEAIDFLKSSTRSEDRFEDEDGIEMGEDGYVGVDPLDQIPAGPMKINEPVKFEEANVPEGVRVVEIPAKTVTEPVKIPEPTVPLKTEKEVAKVPPAPVASDLPPPPAPLNILPYEGDKT